MIKNTCTICSISNIIKLQTSNYCSFQSKKGTDNGSIQNASTFTIMYMSHTCVRSSIAKRNTKSLAVSQGDVNTKLSGRFEKCQSHKVRRADCHRPAFSKKKLIYLGYGTITHLISVQTRGLQIFRLFLN